MAVDKTVTVITLFPEAIKSMLSFGVIGQAQEKEIFKLECVNPRDFSSNAYKTVDDRPFGGGDGMVMMADVLEKALTSIPDWTRAKKIYLSPQGRPLTDSLAQELSLSSSLILISGRYGGIDQRFINEYIDDEVSIGDYVLSGGELAAAVVIDATVRFIPGVLGNVSSSFQDSFSKGYLEHPNFTKPREIFSQLVPETLLSGNHKKIEIWKKNMSYLVTFKKRPELLRGLNLSEKLDLILFWENLTSFEKNACGLQDLELEKMKIALDLR